MAELWQLLGYMEHTGEFWMETCSTTRVMSTDAIRHGSLTICTSAVAKLRELLAIGSGAPPAGMQQTADQLACARLRAELEQARVEGIIRSYTCGCHERLDPQAYWSAAVDSDGGTRTLYAVDELVVLADAAEYVRGLRQPVLPDVEGMFYQDCENELVQRGWQYVHNHESIHGYVRGEVFLPVTYRDIASYRAALARAREIDAGRNDLADAH